MISLILMSSICSVYELLFHIWVFTWKNIKINKYIFLYTYLFIYKYIYTYRYNINKKYKLKVNEIPFLFVTGNLDLLKNNSNGHRTARNKLLRSNKWTKEIPNILYSKHFNHVLIATLFLIMKYEIRCWSLQLIFVNIYV